MQAHRDERPTMGGRLGGYVRVVRSSESGLLGQGLRFAIAGAAVAGVYIVATLTFSHVLRIQFEVALALGFTLALATHFALQRAFVWTHRSDFALPVQHQAGRYLAISAAQYATTAATTGLLPATLHVATDVVYLAVLAIITVTNFLVFRTHVFHARQGGALLEEESPS